MVDTHCHIYREYYDDIPALIEKIKESGVDKIIVNGCNMESNLEVLELVKKYDIVYGAIGFHPTELTDDYSECIQFLNDHINDQKIVALGEIGLDYHYEDTNKEKQIMMFKKQLEIAYENKKPVIVHSRDAIQDTYDILKNYDVKGSIHCYSGSLEMANEFIKIGFSIGIGGVATYKNSKKLLNVIENIDLAYILLETDSPYLSPVEKIGEKNTPANIPLIAKKVAKIKEISVSVVAQKTTENACKLFDF